MLPCYEYFFGNFIFALIPRTMSGNRLSQVAGGAEESERELGSKCLDLKVKIVNAYREITGQKSTIRSTV